MDKDQEQIEYENKIKKMSSAERKETEESLISTDKRCDEIFNDTCLKVSSTLLSEITRDSNLEIYNGIVKKTMESKPDEIISIFIVHIYSDKKYRDAILRSDEDFFKNGNHENFTSSDNDRIKAMFDIKDYWKQLSKGAKNTIKSLFIKMIQICTMKIGCKCKLNWLRSLK